ncbi:mycothiol synthase [Pilimelia columellifera subsp. columellifera]|uniref:Mycothiol acetyltransferase n=1 Tax=Pilimelia columellifera subsp. columellifera TaxID=706583 RepID=A0ABP6AQJ4_9ACTN
MTFTVVLAEHLDPDQVDVVLDLARRASDVDESYPLSEHVVLHLRHGGESPAAHLLARDADGGALVGYAHLDVTDQVAGASAELVVDPRWRRRGIGRELVEAALVAAGESDPRGRLRLWAHGDHPDAAALAGGLGFARMRLLWQLRRSLFAPVDAPVFAEGVRVRAFRPGEDDAAWLALNAAAFADHPEQGGWTAAELRARMAESWFDPAGFLLAERVADGALLGFHWTKVHGDRPVRPSDGAAHAHEPIGEVYVLGVSPTAHGQGLGRALTLAGLRHLRERGLDQAMLYVDESNAAAMALYLGLGFARWSIDVSYARATTG